MAALPQGTGTVPVKKSFTIIVNDVIRNPQDCGDPTGIPCLALQFEPSFHFGCVEVRLVPGATFEPPARTSGPIQKFEGKNAWDFQVSYADLFNMIKPDGSRRTVESSLTTILGEDVWNFVAGRPEAIGYWIVSRYPIKDPFVSFQPLTGEPPGKPEYAPFAEMPSVPSNFPANIEGFGRASLETIPPETFTRDLNLFDLFTMSSPTPTPASIRVITTPPELASGLRPGLPPGLSVETDPSPGEVFEIPSVLEFFGTLTVRSQIDPPEGFLFETIAIVADPQTGDPLFEQVGVFCQDTVPPEVLTHRVNAVASDMVEAMIRARDAITTPLAANFWFSTNGGESWESTDMEPEGDLFEEERERSFSVKVGRLPSGVGRVQYFFTVQDAVANINYFGIGEVTLPPRPIE